jgi:hypothetical protein
MFTIYNSLTEVPEAFREHYVMRGGKAVAEVSSDHPLVVNNATLLNEKSTAESKASTAEAKVQSLQNDLDSAKSSSLPRGHVAVPKSDHELLEKVKAKGTSEEVVKILDDYPVLKEGQERASRDKHLREVAGVLGYEPEAFTRLQNLPEFELRDGTEKDAKGNPKKTVVAKVKGSDNVITEKPGREYVENHPDYKPFLAALKPAAREGTSVHGIASGSGAEGSIYDSIRETVKEEEKQAAASTKTLEQRLNIAAA